MKKFLSIVAVGAALLLSSCMGKQNQAPSEGVNLDSERIYGVRGGDPKQLANEYPEATEETLNKIENIRAKLFPKPAASAEVEVMEAPAEDVATDSTAAE